MVQRSGRREKIREILFVGSDREQDNHNVAQYNAYILI